jgi:two-component system nitrogen regulation sensor histidine kinase NtrY
MGAKAAEKGVELELNVEAGLPAVKGSVADLNQVWMHLVDNAIAAIKTEGTIAISLVHDKSANRMRIEVADSGQGISDEDKTRLFEPNFSTKKTGMGLGLTIVSTIVNDHNGLVRVRDNLPHGAVFIIELPV